MIDKDIIIYANLPAKKYRWISYITLTQIGFLALNLFVLPTKKLLREREEALANKAIKIEKEQDSTSDGFQPRYKLNPDYDPATLFQRLKRMSYNELFTINNVKENLQDRPLISLGIIGVASLITSAFFLYAHRTVHMITLMPGGRVRFAFFSPIFSRPPTLELPLRDVSCVQGRKSKNNYSILKLRKYWGYHLVHKAEGQFLEPKMYDKYLGYKRAWAETN